MEYWKLPFLPDISIDTGPGKLVQEEQVLPWDETVSES